MTLWMPLVLSMTTQVRPMPAQPARPTNPSTTLDTSAVNTPTPAHYSHAPQPLYTQNFPHLPTSKPPPNTHHSTLQWCACVGTDTLLCHDDQLEGRRVAFIYYLVPPTWSEEDGGTLDLYSTDGSCMCHGPPSSGPSHPLPLLCLQQVSSQTRWSSHSSQSGTLLSSLRSRPSPSTAWQRSWLPRGHAYPSQGGSTAHHWSTQTHKWRFLCFPLLCPTRCVALPLHVCLFKVLTFVFACRLECWQNG